jgi:domain.
MMIPSMIKMRNADWSEIGSSFQNDDRDIRRAISNKADVVISFKGQKVLETEIRTNTEEEILLENFRPWSPEEPNLYDAEVTLLKTDAKEDIAWTDSADTEVTEVTEGVADTEVTEGIGATEACIDTADKVSTYFAIRKVDHHKGTDGIERFYLNNRPYFFNGVLNQGY